MKNLIRNATLEDKQIFTTGLDTNMGHQNYREMQMTSPGSPVRINSYLYLPSQVHTHKCICT